jgi:hypothetical protein
VGIVTGRIVFTILTSVAITIVAYGIAWRQQGLVFFNERGHWLLVAMAAQQFVFAAIALFERASAMIQGRMYGTDPVIEGRWLVWLFPGLLMLVLNIYIGRTKCREQHWSRVFYAKGASALLPVIGDLLILLFLERAVRAENPRNPRMQTRNHRRGHVPPMAANYGLRRSRDAAHWCGVIVQFALSGLAAAILFAVLASVFYFVF